MQMDFARDGGREDLVPLRNVFDGGSVWANPERAWSKRHTAERITALDGAIGRNCELPAVAKAAILAREVYGSGQVAQEVQSKAVGLLAQSGPDVVFPDLVYALGPCFLGQESLKIVFPVLAEQDLILLRALLREGANDSACLTRQQCRELLESCKGEPKQSEATDPAEYRKAMRRVVQSDRPDEVTQYLELLKQTEDCPRSSLTALMAVVLSPAFNAHADAIVFCLKTFSEFVKSGTYDINADVIRPIIHGFQTNERRAEIALLRLYEELRQASSA